MQQLSVIILMSVFCLIANTSNAYDFFGASISDKEVPSSYMRYGINGYKLTITDVLYDSPADKAGFKQGDIFLKINDTSIKRGSDLGKFTSNTLFVNLFRGIERITLTIDRLAIETENANRIAKDKKTAEGEINKTKSTIRSNNILEERPDNSAPLKFDDVALERKFGKSTPAELARQKQASDTRRLTEQRDIKIANEKIEQKKHEWDVVSYTHFDRKQYNEPIRIWGINRWHYCTQPILYGDEHCIINFANGVASKLDCYLSTQDLPEVPTNLKQGLRDQLRNAYCKYRTIQLNQEIN